MRFLRMGQLGRKRPGVQHDDDVALDLFTITADIDGRFLVDRGHDFRSFHLVWDLSQYMVLDPGDVMNTGTPVGMAFSDHFPYLADGEVIDLEIDHLGAQRRTVLPALQDAAPGFDHPDRYASASGVVSAYGVAGDHA